MLGAISGPDMYAATMLMAAFTYSNLTLSLKVHELGFPLLMESL